MQHQQVPMGPGQQLHVMQASASSWCRRVFRRGTCCNAAVDLPGILIDWYSLTPPLRCAAHPLPSRKFQMDLPPGGPAAAGPAMLNQMMQLVMEQLLEPNGPAAGLPAGLGGPGGGLGAGFPPPHFPFMFDLNELGELFFDDEEEGEEEDMLEEEEELSDSDVEGAAGEAGVR